MPDIASTISSVQDEEFIISSGYVEQLASALEQWQETTRALDHAERVIGSLSDALQPHMDAAKVVAGQVADADAGAFRDATMRHLADWSSIRSIVARQHETVERIAGYRWNVPTPGELRAAEEALLWYVERTSERHEQVGAVAAEIAADPEKRKVIWRITDGLKRVDVPGLTPYATLVLVYLWLCQVAGLPLVSEPKPAQDDRYLAVIAILVAVASLIQNQSRK